VAPDRFPPGLATGVRRFNAGQFFEAHEAFEDLLDLVEGDDRWDLLVALIQVSVGYHKCLAGHPGAARMLGLGAEKLAAFPAVSRGIAVGRLRERVAEDLAWLDAGRALSPRLKESPPRIEMTRPTSPA
jgi:uncharacterized protein